MANPTPPPLPPPTANNSDSGLAAFRGYWASFKFQAYPVAVEDLAHEDQFASRETWTKSIQACLTEVADELPAEHRADFLAAAGCEAAGTVLCRLGLHQRSMVQCIAWIQHEASQPNSPAPTPHPVTAHFAQLTKEGNRCLPELSRFLIAPDDTSDDANKAQADWLNPIARRIEHLLAPYAMPPSEPSHGANSSVVTVSLKAAVTFAILAHNVSEAKEGLVTLWDNDELTSVFAPFHTRLGEDYTTPKCAAFIQTLGLGLQPDSISFVLAAQHYPAAARQILNERPRQAIGALLMERHAEAGLLTLLELFQKFIRSGDLYTPLDPALAEKLKTPDGVIEFTRDVMATNRRLHISHHSPEAGP